ncbi:MAG: NupC/NupG family nucleoside CNT transporter, partial [Marinirhabdus sp.]
MKRTRLKKTLLVPLLFCCVGTFTGQNLTKNWAFAKIQDTATGVTDSLFLKTDGLQLSDGAFHFSLGAQNIAKGAGAYIFQNNVLVLFFDRPNDSLRRFRVSNLTDSTLTLTEKTRTYSLTAPTRTDTAKTAPTVATNRESTLAVQASRGLGVSLNSIGRGAIGMFFLLFVCFLLSSNRGGINWRLVGTGIVLQLVFAVLVLKVPFVATVFDWVSDKVVTFLNFSEKGAEFLFGGLVTDMDTFGYIFAFKVLPTIIFFSAFTSLLYYLGILQLFVKAFARVMSRTMRLSGAESLAAAANIFIGQTEAPLVVKPYLERMTKSEMLCLMVGGMATIAGGVLAAFITFLGGDSDAEKVIFAKHLLTASVMSAPAAILVAKMLYPETEKVNRQLDISRDKLGTNVLDAVSRGTGQGIKLAFNVGAMLLVFTAIIAVFN